LGLEEKKKKGRKPAGARKEEMEGKRKKGEGFLPWVIFPLPRPRQESKFLAVSRKEGEPLGKVGERRGGQATLGYRIGHSGGGN